jgi:hypothetical protein
LKDIVNIPGVISQKLLWHVTAGAPLDVFAIFFPYPARAADVSIKNRREFTAAETGDVDVLARFPGNRQNFVDGKIGVVASVTFEAGQPLELNGGEQIVVLEQRGARLMNAGVSRENELRHLFNALFLGIARQRSGDQ